MLDKFADDKTGPLFHQELIAVSSTRISLCHSGFRGRPVFSSVRGIVTFNKFKSYCLDSS